MAAMLVCKCCTYFFWFLATNTTVTVVLDMKSVIDPANTIMSVLLIVGLKCTLATSHAAPW